MAYSKQLLDHYENPRNVGSMDKEDTDVGTGLVGAPACGDVMKLQIKVSDQGTIDDAKFKRSAVALLLLVVLLLLSGLKAKHWAKQGKLRIQKSPQSWLFHQ